MKNPILVARDCVQRLADFQPGQCYYSIRHGYANEHHYEGPWQCTEVNFKKNCVRMQRYLHEEWRPHDEMTFYGWTKRFVAVGMLAERSSLFQDLKGSIPVDVLSKRIKEHQAKARINRRRFPGQCCGTCDFYDTLGMCFNVHNLCGGNAPHVHVNTWCEYWEKSKG